APGASGPPGFRRALICRGFSTRRAAGVGLGLPCLRLECGEDFSPPCDEGTDRARARSRGWVAGEVPRVLDRRPAQDRPGVLRQRTPGRDGVSIPQSVETVLCHFGPELGR